MEDLFINSRLTIPAAQLSWSAARSGGPGGQNVNKVNSKVTLKWSVEQCEEMDEHWRRRFLSRHSNRINKAGEVVLQSEKYRDQVRNLADVRQKLVDLLLECQSAPIKRKKTRPTKGSQRRRLDQKKQNSQKKQGRGGSWKSE
ncbi:Peptidyl-tRNA hydrolase ArfB [Rubripirellula amarantea]|uniref:Peptidyl-tRNA hydrolase ArfB n=1 Tax=Rubripirellula amarantea TaxID=2527999 RepID=A0A5C5WIP1_9BACT|nr:alternative ribosome rescue aminoacyl-tRNA hydrolase ArfB [Rubripirellula amarantea]TWT50608.1 Peptidyl-tRNA hydrolase ArfB [Rubripirellula amarantea]